MKVPFPLSLRRILLPVRFFLPLVENAHGHNNLLSFLPLPIRDISLLFVPVQGGGMEIIMRRKIIGVRDFHNSVDITDPCYNRDVWCRMNHVKIKDGKYTCAVWHHTDKYEHEGKICKDKRVGIIGIYLDGVIPTAKAMEEIGSIGVDAGLAGFFHNKPDYSDEAWSKFCDNIAKGDAWLTEDGFFSSSGYGDGCYGVYALKTNEEIVSLEIRFL